MCGSNTIESKRCPQCGETKPLTEFYKNRRRKDGHTAYCKACIKEYNRDYHQRNKEKCREFTRRWRANNPEKFKEQNRRQRRNNPKGEYMKELRYRSKHKEKLYEKGKRYREEHRQYFTEKLRERKELVRASSDGSVTNEFLDELYEMQNGQCAYCGCDLEESGRQVDHIVPISRGGKNTASNVQWVCPSCNMSKGCKLESEWEDWMRPYIINRSDSEHIESKS